jgi:ATP-binding cassette, subfamily B, bacterial
MMGGSGLRLRLGEEVTRQQAKPGTLRRILPYVKRYRWAVVLQRLPKEQMQHDAAQGR